MRALKPVLD